MRIVLSAVVLVLAAGCAQRPGESAIAKGDRYATRSATDFYRYGPQQAGGPDKKLPRGTIVTVTSNAFGYAQVRLADGQPGYVAREALGPAPPESSVAKHPQKPEEARVQPKYAEPPLPPTETATKPAPSP